MENNILTFNLLCSNFSSNSGLIVDRRLIDVGNVDAALFSTVLMDDTSSISSSQSTSPVKAPGTCLKLKGT